jgi:hypothetical protein
MEHCIAPEDLSQIVGGTIKTQTMQANFFKGFYKKISSLTHIFSISVEKYPWNNMMKI